MHKPGWGGRKQKTEESKILMVYRLPADNETVIIFQNPASTMRRQDQLKHVQRSLKITEEIWKELKEGKLDPLTHGIEYEGPDGTASGRKEHLKDVMDRVKAAGNIVDYKNVAAELLKGDGYLSYIPIVQKCFLKKGDTGLV